MPNDLSVAGGELIIAETQPSAAEEHGSRQWLVVAGSMTTIWATYGLLASNGVFLSFWSTGLLKEYPRSSIAWINGVHLFLVLCLGLPVGIIFDKYGSNILMVIGTILYLAGIFGMAESSRLSHFMVAYGVLGGTGCAILSTVAVSVLGHWFDEGKGKGLATGIALLGGSLGGVVFPLALRPMFEKIGWSWSIRALGCFITILLALGLLGVRSRVSNRRTQRITLKNFIRPTCILVIVGVGAFEFALFGALGLLPEFSKSLGNDEGTSYYLITTLNASSAVGRVAAGIMADGIGPYNSMIIVLLIGLFSILAFWLQSGYSVVILYLFAAAFGLSSGGALSLEPLCIGQLCTVAQFGQYYGTFFLAVAAVTMVCIPVGSSLMDSFGQQGFVLFFGAVLLVAVAAFTGARWALMDYTWIWRRKM